MGAITPSASGARRALARELVDAGLLAVDARAVTLRALAELAGDVALRGCTVLAFGKAATAMAGAAVELVGPRGGVVLSPDATPVAGLRVLAAGHPIPVPEAAEQGRLVLTLARSLGEADVALCLISGGGSAMLELPVDGVSVEDIRRTTRALLLAGAPIEELNAVRRALSRLKGGQLAEALAPATVVNVVISDVPGAHPSLVASGPTMVPLGEADPEEVLRRRGLWSGAAEAVRRAVGAARPPAVAGSIRTVVAADHDTARRAMREAAEARGVALGDLPGYVVGEARRAGVTFCAEARARCVRDGIDGVVWGGETTVTVRGRGHGGRNQELVLGAAARFEGGLVLSVGTDGIDGSSGAAGALLDDQVLAEARRLGLLPERYLADNDADGFFAATGGRIVTGPTGTNVADVCLYLND